MAFFTRRGASSVPEIPAASATIEASEEEAKKFSYELINRDGVEV